MKKRIFLVIIYIVNLFSGYSQANNYFQQKANFKIHVSLNDKGKTLDGDMECEYFNNSPDTLTFLWFHLWPNAYKNDKTPFSEQLLRNGRTDFYFSDDSKKGYINQLAFKVNGIPVRTEDSTAIDICKIYLNQPLLPGRSIIISSPFHEKLPYNFSRGGFTKNGFQVTQWYPKPAVYDMKGWHPMSYLDQGEFFSEFGNYDVSITVPKSYIVAATGLLQDEEERNFLLLRSQKSLDLQKNESTAIFDDQYKTLHFHQDSVHDFAWFANKRFLIEHDTLKLTSGKIINCWAFFNPANRKNWIKSVQYIKKTILSRSAWLGEYPYNVVSVVEAAIGFTGGMEYPTITSISPMPTARLLETLIEHEVGHNWNYSILASNEREHPWMDEGINSYFDRRYIKEISPGKDEPFVKSDFINNKLPNDFDDLFYRNAIESKNDQPIETSSENFSELNYNLTAYYKTSLWMEQLERNYGRVRFDSLLHTYYETWKFKHPAPEDFRAILRHYDQIKSDSLFNLIYKKGPIDSVAKRKAALSAFISLRRTDLFNYNFIAPAIGYNVYDGIMAGILFHNYSLPANQFQYLIAPMYAFKSKRFSGLGRFQFHINNYGKIQQILFSLTGASFTSGVFKDSLGHQTSLTFLKIVPSVRLSFREKDPRSTVTRFLQLKTFFIDERNVLFSRDTVLNRDNINYPYVFSYINQLKYVWENHRALYPFRTEIQAEQNADFAKLTLTAKYFFNYAHGGGLNLRIFAGKFFYLGDKTINKQFLTDRYHLNLTGANGYEDYTYSNYFIGRNEFEKFPSQQIMIRDGGFKVRSDLLSAKIGKTDNWLAAINMQSDIPKDINPLNVLPVKIPISIFFDLGTYAEAFKPNAGGSKFLYDAGFQVSLIKNLVNLYIPIVYSKVYRDYYKQTITNNRFVKTISFSIDLQNLNLRKFNPQILL